AASLSPLPPCVRTVCPAPHPLGCSAPHCHRATRIEPHPSTKTPLPARNMTRPSTNICLNMIVKNETSVLPRLFRSLKDYIDYYVIVDTGSTDRTIALIAEEMARYNIDGEV